MTQLISKYSIKTNCIAIIFLIVFFISIFSTESNDEEEQPLIPELLQSVVIISAVFEAILTILTIAQPMTMMERFFEVILLLLDISFLLLSIQQKLANALKFHVISRWLCILLLSLLQDEFKVKNEEESKKEEPTNPEKKVFYTLTGIFFVTEILFYPKMVIVQVVTNLFHFPSLQSVSLLIEVLALYFYNWIYFFNILRVGIRFISILQRLLKRGQTKQQDRVVRQQDDKTS
ncbi:MAG: hypothetical protein EZS28_019878 [Streblomastix strix]|uniref:Uncharacterized protein n=1 Tax=Streblomastix strix TaxID=222440 RepID=A0A5J4VQ22_9EUKA|nr:MAG: hypothetical protein EZS28_019878 [Streblomastix strix]